MNKILRNAGGFFYILLINGLNIQHSFLGFRRTCGFENLEVYDHKHQMCCNETLYPINFDMLCCDSTWKIHLEKSNDT